MKQDHTLRWNVSRMLSVTFAAVLLLELLFAEGCTVSGGSTRATESPFPMLDAYGQWFELAPYGRVWQPTVGYDWRPFAVGGWLWTDRGWYWDSPEPYGWVVYHYGYWTFEGATGWVWVPAYDWSPARVRWYVSEAQVGWAPMIPRAAMSHAVNPEILWCVVPSRYFTAPDVARYRVRSIPPDRSKRPDNEKIAPDVRFVERQTSRPVVRLRTESENIRTGGQKVMQVRVTGEHAKDPLPPADASGGGQQVPQQKTRQQGQTRTRTPVPDSTQTPPRNPR
jgi:hypothetical protein